MKSVMKDIEIVCKKCGRKAKSKEFKLDHQEKMMLCPSCIQEKSKKIITNKTQKSESKIKEENKSLKETYEKKNKTSSLEQKTKSTSAFYPITEDSFGHKESEIQEETENKPIIGIEKLQILPNQEKVKLCCPKCKYEFVYNVKSQYPRCCPYCGTKINDRT